MTKRAASPVEADYRRYVQAHQTRLLRVAWLLTGNWAEAEDLVQTALIRCWPHWERVTRQGSPDAYVRRAVVTAFLSSRRRFWHREVPTDALPDQPAQEAASETRSALLELVRSLPPRQRAVIALRFLDDMSERDVADALNCSVGTVKSQTSKALSALRALPDLRALISGDIA